MQLNEWNEQQWMVLPPKTQSSCLYIQESDEFMMASWQQPGVDASINASRLFAIGPHSCTFARRCVRGLMSADVTFMEEMTGVWG